MANNQDIKLARLEQLLADYQEALTTTRDEKSRHRLQNAITELEDTIAQEKKFRGDRDAVLARKRTFDQARAEIEELIESVQAPGVMHDQDAFNYLVRKYQELTGADNIPRDEEGKSDFEAALAELRYLGDKIQIELDSVYGNVDARMHGKDRNELVANEEQLKALDEKEGKISKVETLIAGYEALDPAGKADFKAKAERFLKLSNKIKEQEKKIEQKEAELKQAQKDLKIFQDKLEALKKEKAELEGKAVLTPEEQKRLAAIGKEITGLEGKIAGVQKRIGSLTRSINATKKAMAQNVGEKDTLLQDNPLLELIAASEELGLSDGDKPFEFTGDEANIADLKTKIAEARAAEDFDAKRKEMTDKVTRILAKYGVSMPADKEYTKALDAKITETLKRYNPAHIQPGFDDRARGEEIDEPEVPGEGDTPPGPGEPPKSSGAPGGAPGTRTSSVGGGFGAGHMFGSGGGSGAPGAPGAPLTPPTPAGTDEMPQPEHEDGNEFHNLLARGEIVERFDGDIDFKTLVDEQGRTKIEDGFVYRVADIGPDGLDPEKREYAQIREPIDWYTKDTTKKIGKALTNLIASLRDMDEEQLKAIWSTLGSNSLDVNLIREAVEKGAIVRAMDHHELMKRVKDIGPKAQIEMLVALTAFSEEDPTRALQAVGSIYSPAKACGLESKLIVGMDDRGKPKVIVPPKAAEEATFGNRYKSQGKGEQRGPQERQPRRDPKKAPKRDRRDQDEMDK